VLEAGAVETVRVPAATTGTVAVVTTRLEKGDAVAVTGACCGAGCDVAGLPTPLPCFFAIRFWNNATADDTRTELSRDEEVTATEGEEGEGEGEEEAPNEDEDAAEVLKRGDRRRTFACACASRSPARAMDRALTLAGRGVGDV